MAFCGSLIASSSRTAWTWTQRGWSVWQRTGRRSSTGERSKCSTFISAIAIVLLLNIIIIESILDNHNSKAELLSLFQDEKNCRRPDPLSSLFRIVFNHFLISWVSGIVHPDIVFLGRCKKSINSHESIKSRNEYACQVPFIPGRVLPVQLYYTKDHGNLTKVSSCKPQDLLKREYSNVLFDQIYSLAQTNSNKKVFQCEIIPQGVCLIV